MKTILVHSLLILLLLLASPHHSFAQTLPPDEGEDIEVIVNNTTYENGPGRSSELVPLSAIYYSSVSCILVDFLSNIGSVTISLSNLSTGDSYNTVVDSTHGAVIIPFSNCPGIWRIGFQPETGTVYEGYFTII